MASTNGNFGGEGDENGQNSNGQKSAPIQRDDARPRHQQNRRAEGGDDDKSVSNGEESQYDSLDEAADALARAHRSTTVSDRHARHGNPTGVATPERSPTRARDAATPSCKSPTRFPETSPQSRKENTHSRSTADAPDQALFKKEVWRLVYVNARAHRYGQHGSEAVKESIKTFLAALDRADDAVAGSITRELLELVLDRSVKCERAEKREAEAKRHANQWRALYDSVKWDLDNCRVECLTLESKVAAYEQIGASTPAAGLGVPEARAPAPQNARTSMMNYTGNYDDLFKQLKMESENPQVYNPRAQGTRDTPVLFGDARSAKNQPTIFNQQQPTTLNQQPLNYLNSAQGQATAQTQLLDERVDARVRTLKLEPKFSGLA